MYTQDGMNHNYTQPAHSKHYTVFDTGLLHCIQKHWGIVAAAALPKYQCIVWVLEIPHSGVVLFEAVDMQV